jgi:hypothetical protein
VPYCNFINASSTANFNLAFGINSRRISPWAYDCANVLNTILILCLKLKAVNYFACLLACNEVK